MIISVPDATAQRSRQTDTRRRGRTGRPWFERLYSFRHCMFGRCIPPGCRLLLDTSAWSHRPAAHTGTETVVNDRRSAGTTDVSAQCRVVNASQRGFAVSGARRARLLSKKSPNGQLRRPPGAPAASRSTCTRVRLPIRTHREQHHRPHTLHSHRMPDARATFGRFAGVSLLRRLGRAGVIASHSV